MVKGSSFDLLHYEGNVLDRIKALEARITALEATELSGVAGPPGPTGDTGPVGPPGPGTPSPLTRGDLLVVDATPEITTLGIGAAQQHLHTNAGGTDPEWSNLVDLNGLPDGLVLDTDGDTTLSAPTDDQIDIEIGGSDQIVLSASEMVVNEQGADIDLRIEAVGVLHALFIRGSDGVTSIGTGSPSAGMRFVIVALGDHTRFGIGDPAADKYGQFTFQNIGGDWTVAGTSAAGGNAFQIIRGITPILTILPDGKIGANGVTSPSTELDIGAGAMEFDEMAAPAAGAANTARLFCRDNGAGKSQLCVIFATGAIQVLATEP